MTTVTANGKDFLVEMPDFNKVIAHLESMKNEYLKGNIGYNPLWETGESNQEDVLSDLNEMVSLLRKIEAKPEILAPFIEEIRKKKNGWFWSNSGTDVRIAENCTEYFTDFTNAWSALMIRLDVLTEDTCKLSVRNRTFTH